MRKTVVTLIDDINGKEADDTVTFALDGTSYEIDLTQANSDKLRAILRRHADAARKMTGKPARIRKRTATGRELSLVIREWASERPEYASRLKPRGRIPADIVAAYHKIT